MSTQSDRRQRPPRAPVLDEEDRPGPPPLLSEEPQGGSRALTVFIALFALLAFAGVVWFAYDQGRQAGTEVTAPLIKADPSPVKVRPSDPGGLQVPHRDKLVFGSLEGGPDGETTNGQVERLLPPPEPPLAPPVPPAAEAGTEVSRTAAAPDAAGQSTSGPTRQQDIPPARVAPPPSPAVPVPDADPKPPVAAAPIASAPPPVAPPAAAPREPVRESAAPADAESSAAAVSTPAPAPAPAPAAPPPAAGDFRVQIGALRSEDAARAEWQRVSGRHAEALGGLTLHVERVEVTGKGTFWRAQGGPLAEADARSICGRLDAAGQPCIVVRR